jgi:hypothetical protein
LNVGINFTSKLVSILVFIQTGFTHIKNNQLNIKIANKKFIKIQASIIIDCCQIGLFIRLSSDLISSNLFNNSFFSSILIFSQFLKNISFQIFK